MLQTFIPVRPTDATLLGALCLTACNLDIDLDKCRPDLERAKDRLSLLDSDDILVLLSSYFIAPKILLLPRCSPCFGNLKLAVFDNF
jgi:hypothetical protein